MLALLLSLAADPAGMEEVRIEAPALTLRLPELEGLAQTSKPGGDLVGQWSGQLAGSTVTIQVAGIDQDRLRVIEPEELALMLEQDHVERNAQRGRAADFQQREPVKGDFGWLPYATLGVADVRAQTEVVSRLWVLTGLTETHGWAVQVEATPGAIPEVERAVLAFLKGGV